MDPAPANPPPGIALKYAPDQPRVSPGNSDGGQWTDGGGGGGTPSGGRPRNSNSGSSLSDSNSGDANSRPVQVAGRGGALKALLKMLRGSKPAKVPEFLIKKPKAGKLTGKLDDLTPDERKFAEEMRDLGNEVDVIPTGPGRTPDLRLNGKAFERKTVSGVQQADSDGISSAIASRTLDGRGQAADIIIDARTQSGMTKEIADRAIKRAYGADKKSGIDSITILTPDGPVFAPRSN